jgi:hypothetical protein
LDLLISVNYDDETQENSFFFAKNRHGEGRRTVGPLPTNYALGQVAPVERNRLPTVRRREVASAASVGAAVHSLTGDLGQAINAASSALDGKGPP